ncbi:MAG: hypothetical protein ABW205_10420 [Burkholderiales bacterium]|jgi:hypothetical protein
MKGDEARGLRLGHRVWVNHDDGRAYGRIASLPPVLSSAPARFVVLLDGKRTVVVCSEDRKGGQWDFAGNGEGI